MLSLFRRFSAAALFGALLFTPAFAAAQQGTITGRVTDDGTATAIAGAQVLVVGVNRSTLTDRDGRYTLRNVPPGRIVVRVTAIGHQARQATLTIAAGETISQDFALAGQQLSLDELVVTASGDQRKRELGHAIASIDATDVVANGQINSLANLIQGRSAGVQILNTSGQTGSGSRVRIRGASSISLNNSPLLYVDGVRVDNRQGRLPGNFAGGQETSSLNDFNPDDIESIEIIKGPAAATLYGTEAANGVIRIKTKRGTAGAPRWNAYVEQGAVFEGVDTEYPLNFQSLDAAGGTCTLADASAGTCSITNTMAFTPLEDSRFRPFRAGHRQQYGANVSGGSEVVQYFVSAEWEAEDGVYALNDADKTATVATFGEIPDEVGRPNQLNRLSFRGNVRGQILDNADVNVSLGVVSSDLSFPTNDNSLFSPLLQGMWGAADPGTDGGWRQFTPAEMFAVLNKSGVERYTTAVSANWQPFAWLSGRANLGLDYVSLSTEEFNFTGTGPDFGEVLLGSRERDEQNNWQYTADLGATAQFQLSDRISSKTAVGVQYFRNILRQTETDGSILPPGARSNKNASEKDFDEDEIEDITLGTYVEQQFGWNDRIFVTGAVRADDNSAFGREFDVQVYPKVSASWLVSEEPWFPQTGFLDNLRFRGAWGASGLQPGPNDALDFFVGVSVVDGGSEVSGVSISGTGNDLLKPERSSEVELGVDANLFNGRVGFELTYFNKQTSNALVSVPLAPSFGIATSRFENIGETSNVGIEAVVNAVVLESDNLSWDVTLSGSTFSNNVDKLTLGDPITFNRSQQRHVEGHPLGAFWGVDIQSFSDNNNDGMITVDELVMTDEAVLLGESFAPHEASLTNSVTLFDRFRLTGLLDYRGGHVQVNSTERFRCNSARNCRGLHDPTASLEEQAVAQSIFVRPSTRAAFVDDAWFAKLREISLTFFAPQSWAQALRVDRLSFTASGRNLLTITDYDGIDPEVNEVQTGNFSSSDFNTTPQSSYFTFRMNLTF